MSVEIKVIVSEPVGATALWLYDNTGPYDVVTNPTGWGAPNKAISDISKIDVEIEEIASGETGSKTFNNPYWLGFVNYTGLSLNIADFFPSNTTYNDGIYKITITITFVDTSTTECIQYTAVLALISCCVKKKFLTNSISCLNTEQALQTQLYEYLLQAVRYASECGYKIEAQNIIDYLTNICSGCEAPAIGSCCS